MRKVMPTGRAVAVLLAGAMLSAAERGVAAQAPPPSAARSAQDAASAWRMVAACRYLTGDLMGALEAWNRTGEPRLDTIDVHGTKRTRQPVVVQAEGLKPGQVLTAEAFGRALRRVRDLPVASAASMRYEPVDSGLARLDVSIDERPVVPRGWPALAALAARALVMQELRADVAGPLGEGERVSAAWKWSAARPRVMLGLAVPAPRGLPGIISFDGLWERQSYGATVLPGDATAVREERRRVGVHLGDWQTSWLRWQTGVALDRLSSNSESGLRAGARDYLSTDSTVDVRLADDHVAIVASGGWWAPLAGGTGFGTGRLLAAWRSTDDPAARSWSASGGFDVSSRVAPLALWQGAGTGHGRSGALLRAHPLLNAGGVLTGQVFGRQLVHGSLEFAQPVRPVGRVPAGALSIAAFVDAAQAWQRLSGAGPSPLFVDAGVGVRVRAPGHGGVIRIDVARGLRGGGATLSASWASRGPGRFQSYAPCWRILTVRRAALRLWAGSMLALTALSVGVAAQEHHASPGKANAAPLPERIWRDPGDAASLDLLYGAGGKAHAPDPAGVYTFLREELRGSSPKFDVVDGQGVVWRVKLGFESRPETAATRFLWAAGYFVDEDFFLSELRVEGLPRLRRGQQFVSLGGVVRNARLERRLNTVQKLGHWDWFANPFLGQRELNGLRVMMALLNSWDLKAVNNAIYVAGGEREYAVSDLGSSFGRSGRDGIATKGVPRDFAEAAFIRKVTPESVDFVLRSRPIFLAWVFRHSYYTERTRMERIARRVPRADARWLGDRLSKLTDDQIRDAFRAAGFEPADVETLTRAMRQRIAALEAL